MCAGVALVTGTRKVILFMGTPLMQATPQSYTCLVATPMSQPLLPTCDLSACTAAIMLATPQSHVCPTATLTDCP